MEGGSLGGVSRANRKVGSSKQKVLAKHAGKHLIAEAMNVSQEPITFYHRKTHAVHTVSYTHLTLPTT